MRHRTHRTGRHGRKSRPQHRQPRLLDRRLQPHDQRDRRLHGRPRQAAQRRRLPYARRLGRVTQGPAEGDDDGQGRPGRGPADRHAHPPALQGRRHHRRRQHAPLRHRPPHAGGRGLGAALHRHRRLRRRRGRSQGTEPHARRIQGRLAAHPADLPGHRRQGRPQGRHPLLRLGRPTWRRQLCEDGSQRHRIRRHAADLRGLLAPEAGGRSLERSTGQGVRHLEPRRTRQLSHRDHPRHLHRPRSRHR